MVMRIVKNSCFRHGSTQLFLITWILIIGVIYFFWNLKIYAVQNIQKNSSTLTQSQAHMSLPRVKTLIRENYKIKPYEKLIETIIACEEKYKEDYCVFYHGMDSVWRIAQDVYTKLYLYFNSAASERWKDFIFLRFDQGPSAVNVRAFLLKELHANGLINDHDQMGKLLLSVNLALFGNVGVPSECSWEYFIKSRNHAQPTRAMHENIMEKFGLTTAYIDELISLIDLYKTKEQMLVQIFIPKNRINDIGYVSWIKGIPADEAIMSTVFEGVAKKKFPKTQQAIESLTSTLKKEKEKNPLFKNLIARVEHDDFNLGNFLYTYCNDQESIKNSNLIMARLIFTSELLLNPFSEIKIFRYSTATSKQMENYYQKLDEIMKKIISGR